MCLLRCSNRCCCCCWHIQHPKRFEAGYTESKIPVKYLEFYSFACHVIEIFTCFFSLLFSARQTFRYGLANKNVDGKRKQQQQQQQQKRNSSFMEFLSEIKWMRAELFFMFVKKSGKMVTFSEDRNKKIQPLCSFKWYFSHSFLTNFTDFILAHALYGITHHQTGNWITLSPPKKNLKSHEVEYFVTLL